MEKYGDHPEKLEVNGNGFYKEEKSQGEVDNFEVFHTAYFLKIMYFPLYISNLLIFKS